MDLNVALSNMLRSIIIDELHPDPDLGGSRVTLWNTESESEVHPGADMRESWMRRSAAPSRLLQGNAAKKPRFVPPAPVHPGAGLLSNPGPVLMPNTMPISSPGPTPTSTPKLETNNVLNKVQKSLTERAAGTPGAAKVSVMGKALARVLSVVAQEERNENDADSLNFPLDSEQRPDSPSAQQPGVQCTHTTTTTSNSPTEKKKLERENIADKNDNKSELIKTGLNRKILKCGDAPIES
ncbi:DNA repair and recombination protein RAD54B [Silurus asotus]|uniref:DNA repair and recombination protein RAD54B n=1 Tax=Silurus asotus TaxID=30991 RepID=A0AAD5FM67_SILAS|nr:DNA repair and recombination protein RAD54B [Silurus asotus]